MYECYKCLFIPTVSKNQTRSVRGRDLLRNNALFIDQLYGGFPSALSFPPRRKISNDNIRDFKNAFISSMSFLFN